MPHRRLSQDLDFQRYMSIYKFGRLEPMASNSRGGGSTTNVYDDFDTGMGLSFICFYYAI
jgi:hypothetical protein